MLTPAAIRQLANIPRPARSRSKSEPVTSCPALLDQARDGISAKIRAAKARLRAA